MHVPAVWAPAITLVAKTKRRCPMARWVGNPGRAVEEESSTLGTHGDDVTAALSNAAASVPTVGSHLSTKRRWYLLFTVCDAQLIQALRAQDGHGGGKHRRHRGPCGKGRRTLRPETPGTSGHELPLRAGNTLDTPGTSRHNTALGAGDIGHIWTQCVHWLRGSYRH